jgi:hypothetical protein
LYVYIHTDDSVGGPVTVNQFCVLVGSDCVLEDALCKMFTGGDAGSLYPHLYNIHPSLLTQLGSKHSRLGVHIQDQLQVTVLRTLWSWGAALNCH